jgi:hypothetical protein
LRIFGMRIVFANTDAFWAAMCNPAFVRTSLNAGRMGCTMYIVDVPPEDVPGFIDAKIAATVSALETDDRPLWKRIFG